jgi:hypothetical protein
MNPDERQPTVVRVGRFAARAARAPTRESSHAQTTPWTEVVRVLRQQVGGDPEVPLTRCGGRVPRTARRRVPLQ